MYAKCGSIEDVQKVFDMMLKHNVVSWSTMILGHVTCGQALKALKLFQQMQHEGVQPDLLIFVGVLNASASAGVFMNRLFIVVLSLISLWVLA
jgi:pentatricopeptide repeat protein